MFAKFFDLERLIHSVKTMTACLIGFLLTKMIGFSAGQWIVITIIVVMCAQIYVGSVIQKAYFRFLGTLIGCLFAIVILMTLGDSFFAIAIAIALSSFFFSYLATAKENLVYTATLGAVTTTIIMMGQSPTIIFAGERFLEISVGVLIATLISQFFLPIHARTHIRRRLTETLSYLKDYYRVCMTMPAAGTESYRYEEVDEDIVDTLSKQRQLAKEAKREPLGESFDPDFFIESLHCEKEMLRAVDFMHYALTHFNHGDSVFVKSTAFTFFNNTILQSLSTLERTIKKAKVEQNHIHIPSLNILREELTKIFPTPTANEERYMGGYLFSAEIFIENLKKLATLYQLPIYTIPSLI